jgi:acyl carrier protein
MLTSDQTNAIRDILREHGRLAQDVAALSDQSDLFEAGLTSHASVNLMLALEDHFQIEFRQHGFCRTKWMPSLREALGL